MSLLDLMFSPSSTGAANDYDAIQSLLSGGANPSESALPQTGVVSARPALQEPELAALDTDAPAQEAQSPIAQKSAETPLTIDDFIKSQLGSLEDPSLLDRRSEQEQQNADSILQELNAGAGKTPLVSEFLSAAAALLPAIINKGSGADAGLASYQLGRKQMQEDEANKRALLTDRFKIAQNKIDKYDTKAASIRQQKTGLLGTLLSAKENREARAEESKLRREEMAVRRQESAAARQAQMAQTRAYQEAELELKKQALWLKAQEQQRQNSEADRRKANQLINLMKEEGQTSFGGILARIPGLSVSSKDAEEAKNMIEPAQTLFSKLDNLQEVYSGGTLMGKPVSDRSAVLNSLSADIAKDIALLKGMGANWTAQEMYIGNAMAALSNLSYDASTAVLKEMSGMGDADAALADFTKRLKGGVHDSLAVRGAFWPGRYGEINPETALSLERKLGQDEMNALVSAWQNGLPEDRTAFDSPYAGIRKQLFPNGISASSASSSSSGSSSSTPSALIIGKRYRTNLGDKTYKGIDNNGKPVWE